MSTGIEVTLYFVGKLTLIEEIMGVDIDWEVIFYPTVVLTGIEVTLYSIGEIILSVVV